ncbi:MAG TPA: O-antigen ligase family protein, partial [Polyangiaceae bacterium]|nr:O-antigen ligase family protein [Polyangiaceae bacterium]
MIVVIGSALAIGTVHIPALLAISALALVGGTLGAMAFRRVPAPAIVLAVLGVLSALQAIPLPAGLVRRLSPISAEVWSRCLVPFGEGALTRFPLSLDGGASAIEALKWFTYAAVYIMATRVRSRRGSSWLATLLFGSAVLVTLITLVHGVADLNVLYGVYEPNFTVGRWNVGPLLNSNNLAGYAILGLFSGAGLLLSGRSALPPLLLAVGLAVISTALCLSGSRAAILSTLLAGGVTLVWLIKVQRFRLSPRHLLWGVAPFLIGIVIAIAVGTSKDWGALATLDARRKFIVWSWSLPMIREHVWFGVGRGAFETAFSPYRQALDYDWTIVISHAENFVVQWVAEWGVPVGLCAVVLIVGYVLREWRANRSDRVRFMIMTGLVALLVQNLADLGLEIPAVAIAAVLALAAGERPVPRPATESANRLGLLALAGFAPAFALWLAVILWARFPVESERREMALAYRELPAKSADERAQFRGHLRRAVLRHPGESFFPLLGSLVALRTGDGNPLPWIARSLDLAPANGRVHLVLAQLLEAHNATSQAMLHLRLAAQYDRTLAGTAGVHAVRWARSVDMLMQAIPDGPSGDTMLLGACAREPRIEAKIDCFRHATLRNPSDPDAQGQLAGSLLFALRSEQLPCNGTLAEGCAAEATRAIRAMARLQPRSWRPGYLTSKLLLARGDAKGAAQLLARVCPTTAEGDECAREAVMTAIRSRSDDAILAAVDASAARACDSSVSCADALD